MRTREEEDWDCEDPDDHAETKAVCSVDETHLNDGAFSGMDRIVFVEQRKSLREVEVLGCVTRV